VDRPNSNCKLKGSVSGRISINGGWGGLKVQVSSIEKSKMENMRTTLQERGKRGNLVNSTVKIAGDREQ